MTDRRTLGNGGYARAAKMTAEERSLVASNAAKARWANLKSKTKEKRAMTEETERRLEKLIGDRKFEEERRLLELINAYGRVLNDIAGMFLDRGSVEPECQPIIEGLMNRQMELMIRFRESVAVLED
jgi:hypothetical protein